MKMSSPEVVAKPGASSSVTKAESASAQEESPPPAKLTPDQGPRSRPLQTTRESRDVWPGARKNETAMHLCHYQGRCSLHYGRRATAVRKTDAIQYHTAPQPGRHRNTQVRPRGSGHLHHRPGRRQPRPRATATATSGHSPAADALAAPSSRPIRMRAAATNGPDPRGSHAGEQKQPRKPVGSPSQHPHRQKIRGSPRVTTSP